ncbi:hypothetical protein [Polyangium mundeleinium]|uniref:Uncharacterized protein n=1 Tax=Polyangium mundeleinium TaxID=2995306 RepID=A0ABT5F180_9BACT|nr:hypothetical protein [Polyangium mundeleinium]MDC0747359.1 hypothetical protein [Polyangium mundeleinium]
MSSQDDLAAKVAKRASMDPRLREALSAPVDHGRDGMLATRAPRIKDTELDVVKAALDNPPKRPDGWAALVGGASALGLIAKAIKDIVMTPGNGFDVAILVVGTSALIAQTVVYLVKRDKVKTSEPFHEIARRYVNSLLAVEKNEKGGPSS